MRQFLLGAKAVYGASLPLSVGSVAFTTLVNGVPTIDKTGAEALKGKFYIELGTAHGTKSIAGTNNNFSYKKADYSAGSQYSGSITIPAVTANGDYTLMLVKKGLKFNERNRWTVTLPVKTDDNTTTIAKKFVEAFTAMTGELNIKVTNSTATVNFAGLDKHDDFKIIPADDLMGTKVTNTASVQPMADVEMVKDLANKAAADMGFEYTYEDVDVNPGYPINPLKVADAADTGFTIFTLRFAVPRDVKTRDEVVNQIVQVAFPTGAGAITEFEAVCKAIATGAVAGAGA